MELQTILFEKKSNYAIITLNRPDKLNALNTQLFTDLNNAIEVIENDREIYALIVTGSGAKAFAAGADIVELNKSDERSGYQFSQFGTNVMTRLSNLRIPVIAAVNGLALGGGCELTMACHIRFASDNAKFGQPEVNLGILPGYGGTQRLPRLVGFGKAIELIISGKIIDANEAYRIGLVNEVFTPEELLPKTIEFIELVLTKGQIAVSASVEAVKSSTENSLLEGLNLESRLFGKVCGSEDFQEGTSAFIEKRNAEFKGN